MRQIARVAHASSSAPRSLFGACRRWRRTTIRRGRCGWWSASAPAGRPTSRRGIIADKLGTLLGQRLIVENKTGAAGMLATRDVLAQPADGYNLLLCTHFESINTAALQESGVQARRPRADLADRADTTTASRSPTPFRSTTSSELVQYAKAHPGEISYATLGAGSAQEILARQIEKLAGIR